jgi:hypothetical protein
MNRQRILERLRLRASVLCEHRVVTATAIYLEEGRSWTFAAALDWPGWCRRGKGPDAAVDALGAYRARYAAVAGRGVPRGGFEVIGRIPGGSGTDFGVPSAIGEWDLAPLSSRERTRLTGLLSACWDYFDVTARASPAHLRKGRRGGGRDRDAIVDHVREAERAYGPRMGLKLPAGAAWADQRAAILRAFGSYGEPRWPPRYAVRRLAWHVLDHAWEMEDRRD